MKQIVIISLISIAVYSCNSKGNGQDLTNEQMNK